MDYLKSGFVLIFVSLIFWGCVSVSPHLHPISPDPPSSQGENDGQITLFVKPIITAPFTSEDREKYGLDLSAHFTAFDLTVLNKSPSPFDIDLQNILLIGDDAIKHYPLNPEESIRYFRKKEEKEDGAVILISKPFLQMKKEIEIIQQLHFQSGSVEPGEKKGGVLFFRRLPLDQCSNVRLVVGGMSVGEGLEERKVTFHFSCQPTGFERIR